MLAAIIIDDEKANRENLLLEIKAHCHEVNIKAVCSSGEEGVTAIKLLQPDLVFLDIEMPYMNGFEMLGKLQSLDFALIFVTAHAHYAVEAFEQNAIAYLLKPISPEKLKSAIKKAIVEQIKTEKLSDLLKTVDEYRKKMVAHQVIFSTSDGNVKVNTDSILYVKSDGNYARIYMENGSQYFVSSLLKVVLEQLPPSFCRIHRQEIVNIQQVHSYLPGDGGWVVLTEGTKLKVSRSYRKGFLKEYDN